MNRALERPGQRRGGGTRRRQRRHERHVVDLDARRCRQHRRGYLDAELAAGRDRGVSDPERMPRRVGQLERVLLRADDRSAGRFRHLQRRGGARRGRPHPGAGLVGVTPDGRRDGRGGRQHGGRRPSSGQLSGVPTGVPPVDYRQAWPTGPGDGPAGGSDLEAAVGHNVGDARRARRGNIRCRQEGQQAARCGAGHHGSQ